MTAADWWLLALCALPGLLGMLLLWAVAASMCPLSGSSPEKPAGAPPREPVFLLPDGEVWDAQVASWHVKAPGQGLNRRDWR